MEKNVIQIRHGITTDVDVSVKNISVEKSIFGVLLPIVANSKYLRSIIDNSAITCDEIIEEETKTVTTNFNEKKKQSAKQKFLNFTCLFINYHCIIDSC